MNRLITTPLLLIDIVNMNTTAFIQTLRQCIGEAHVLTDGDLSSYEQDWRKRTRGKALAVVRPSNTHKKWPMW